MLLAKPDNEDLIQAGEMNVYIAVWINIRNTLPCPVIEQKGLCADFITSTFHKDILALYSPIFPTSHYHCYAVLKRADKEQIKEK